MQDDAEVFAPILLRYEVTSAIYRKAHTGQISKEDALLALQRFLEMDIVHRDPPSLPIRAFELAEHYNRPNTYEGHYLALTEIFKSPFWTADERLYNSTRGSFQYIQLIRPGS